MSEQHIRDKQEMNNPFKLEGLFYYGSGSLIAIIGIIPLFTLKKSMSEQQGNGWLTLIISIFLITVGILFVVKGFQKRARFYHEEMSPLSLVTTQLESNKIFYRTEQIEQIIAERTNPTYQEGQTLLEKYLLKYFPKMIYLPYSVRNSLTIILQNTAYSFSALILYSLVLLSGAVGLTKLTTEGVPNWLGLMLLIILLMIWVMNPLTIKRMTQKHLYKGKRSTFFIVLTFQVIIAIIMELILRHDIQILHLPLNMTLPLLVYYVLLSMIMIVSLLLAKYRSESIKVQIEVSEYRDHWQEKVHPKFIFRWLDEEIATLSGKRTTKNRIYKKLSPHIHMSGKMNHGQFSGDTLQETEPVSYEVKPSPILEKIKLYSTMAAHSLFVIAAILLFNGKTESITFVNVLHVVFYPALLTLFAFVLLVMTHAYWGEVYFISYLIYFHGEGEYEESDMTDDGIAQSNQEVKTFFRPSLSFGKMITHTHATIGDKPLSNTRYIASIEKADDLLSEWIQEMSRTLDEKRVIQGYKDMTDSTEKRNKKVAKEGSTSIQQENKNQTLEQEENDVVNDADDIKNIPSNHDIKHLENNKKEISKQEKLEDDSTPMT